MEKKGNDTITTNKEVDVFDCACEEEEEPLPFLHFPLLVILVVRWRNI
jgi:hypothetical protein